MCLDFPGNAVVTSQPRTSTLVADAGTEIRMLSNRPKFRRAAVLLCAACSAPASAAQNYAANGDFDIDLSNWQASGSPLPAWTMTDYQGSAMSGSAAFENDAASTNTRTYPLMQCVTPP